MILRLIIDVIVQDLSKDGGTDVECHFCDKKYHFTPEEILGLIKE